jgi:hypothetical protein
MSTKKKTKKLRRPNYAAAGLGGPSESRGGGAEIYPQPVRNPTSPMFDYSHVRQDMRRIALLSGLCVTFLVVLSFFI